jgi:uncharacterized membrane protein YhaH (DUF805 family)
MFKNIFSFDGRIRRTEFGISYIIYTICYVVIRMIVEPSRELALLYLAFIPLLWFLLAQGSKRCHDIGNSGWYQLIPFYVFWLLFAVGQPYENRYGDNPKMPSRGFDEMNYQDPVDGQKSPY